MEENVFKSIEFYTHKCVPHSFIQPVVKENKHYDRWIHDLTLGCKGILSNQKGGLS